MSELHTYTLAEIEERTGFDKRTISYYVQQGLLPKVGRRGPKTRYPQLFLDRLSFVKLVRDKQDQGEIGSLTLAEIRDLLNRMPDEMVGDVVAGRERLDLEDLCGPELASTPAISAREHALDRAQRFEDVVNGSNDSRHQSEQGSQIGGAEHAMDVNRKVRLGVMDAASRVKLDEKSPESPRPTSSPHGAPAAAVAAAADTAPEPAARTEPAAGPVAVNGPTGDGAGTAANGSTDDAFQQATDQMVADRIGWALARLQRALTNAPRLSRGNTESWHRARITPELTISARNLPDEQAYLLDNLSRILKKLLWEAWEE